MLTSAQNIFIFKTIGGYVLAGRSYEPNGRSFTEVIRDILNETSEDNKKAQNTAEGDIGQQAKVSVFKDGQTTR